MTDEAPELPAPVQVAEREPADEVMARCRDAGAVRTDPYGHERFYVLLPRRPEPCWMSAALLDGCLRL